MTCGPDGCRDPREAPQALPRPRRKLCASTWTTTSVPGPIAVLQLVGEIEPVLERIAGKVPDPGQAVLASLANVDTGVIARVNARVALLMPHGGLRIRKQLETALVECGVMYAEPSFAAAGITPLDLYPEAEDDAEARVLDALARAASPIAIQPLLREAARVATRAMNAKNAKNTMNPMNAAPEAITAADVARGERLWRMVEPARVAVVGRVNAGKSSLLNRVSGYDLALSGPEPGLTRDAVAARIDLAGLVVDWFDTPGLRGGADPIERDARTISASLERAADLVIAIAEPGGGWPDVPRVDLHVVNKIDLPGAEASPEAAQADLAVSARRGDGIDELVRKLRDTLLPKADLEHPGPWVLPHDTAATAH